MKAQEFLTKAGDHMQDRANTYDKPQGERSMAATVGAFNVINGTTLTEEQGWMFMELLKIVRSVQGEYKADNYEDAVAYAALRGECASVHREDRVAQLNREIQENLAGDDVVSLGLKHRMVICTAGERMRQHLDQLKIKPICVDCGSEEGHTEGCRYA